MERVLPKSNLCQLYFSSGFESWSDFQNHGFDFKPALGTGSETGDDTVSKTKMTLQSTVKRSGSRAFQANAYGFAADSTTTDHFAYPLVQFDKLTNIALFSAVYVEFWVYVDKAVPTGLWQTLATFSNDPQNKRTIGITVDDTMTFKLDGVPFQYYSSPNYINKNVKLQTGKWTNITMYLDFDHMKGVTALWVDDVLTVVADVKNSNGGLYTATFGMAQSQWFYDNNVYNDDLKIWTVNNKCNSVQSSNGVDYIVTAGSSSVTASSFLILLVAALMMFLF